MTKGRQRGRRAKTGKAVSSDPSATSRESDDDQVDFDPARLSLLVEGQWKSFREWTLENACNYYPLLGRKTYRVPPVDFNTQDLTDDASLDFYELHSPKEEIRKKDRSQADVGRRLEELGQYLEGQQQEDKAAETRDQQRGRGLFVVSNAHYDNYLSYLKGQRTRGSRLPPLPKEVAQRGELDFLVLHPHHGILLVQVKGVGLPDSWTPTQEELQAAVRKKVKEARGQLSRDEVVLHHVMADLQLTCNLHRVVALPFVSQRLLADCLAEDVGEGESEEGDQDDTVYMCADHVRSLEDMILWWSSHIEQEDSTPLTDFQLRSIVGRHCGLLSTVSVWCKSSLRIEVRDMAEAVVEVGNRFAQLVLTPEQRKVLDTPQRLLYLHGPPGTGKSVMLIIKARHWLTRGHDVIVLNLDFGRPGNPVGHYIHDGISQWLLKTFHHDDDQSAPTPPPGVGKPSSSSSSAGLGKRSPLFKNFVDSSDDSGVSSDNAAVPSSPKKPLARKGHDDSPAMASQVSAESVELKRKAADVVDTAITVSTESSMASERKAADVDVVSAVSTENKELKRKAGDADTTGCQTAASSCDSASLSSGSSSGSDTDSSRLGDHGQVFRIDFDLELGGTEGGGGAGDRVEQLLRLIEGTMRPGVPCHLVMDELYWKERLMPVVEGIKQRFPHSCVWSAEVSGEPVPPGFTPFMLTKVLRCPPLLQTVLKPLDWIESHQSLYVGDSTLTGLPTDGLKPTLLEHKDHSALSPLDCVQCADLLLKFFHEELKLDFMQVPDQGQPHARFSETSVPQPGTSSSQLPSCSVAVSPGGNASGTNHQPPQACQRRSLPLQKSKKKRRPCVPQRVKFSEIVVLFSYPQQCVRRTSDLLLIEDRPQDIHHHNIENSVFLGRMKEAGLPVVFHAPNSDAREIALPTEDRVLFTTTNAITGLERKVVVYIPCESTTYDYPVTRRPARPSNTPQSSLPVGQVTPSGPHHLEANPENAKPGDTANALDTQDIGSHKQQEQSSVSFESHSKGKDTTTPSEDECSLQQIANTRPVVLQDGQVGGGGGPHPHAGCPCGPQVEDDLSKSAEGQGANHDHSSQGANHDDSSHGANHDHSSHGAKHDHSSHGAKHDHSSHGAKHDHSSHGAKHYDISHGANHDHSSQGAKHDHSSHGANHDHSSQGAKHDHSSHGANHDHSSHGAKHDHSSQGAKHDDSSQGAKHDDSSHETNYDDSLIVHHGDDISTEQNCKDHSDTNPRPLSCLATGPSHEVTEHRNLIPPPVSDKDSELEIPQCEDEPNNSDGLPMESVSPVTTALSEQDWAKIHDRLKEQSLKGLFYAASRSLSVFVLIIP